MGTVQSTATKATSPLTGETIVYCRWTVTRRQLNQGRNDRIAHEVHTPFTVAFGQGTEPIDLAHTYLHLSDQTMTAWTSQWEGLKPPIQHTIRTAMGDELPDALYHCQEIRLSPNTVVSWSPSPALLTDLDIPNTNRWSLRRCLPPLGLAALLALTGWSF